MGKFSVHCCAFPHAQNLNTIKRVSHFVDKIHDLFSVYFQFVEFALFVPQYSQIMFINKGESENSNNEQEFFEFIRIYVVKTCMTWPGM